MVSKRLSKHKQWSLVSNRVVRVMTEVTLARIMSNYDG